MIENYTLRRVARMALKPQLPIALVIALLATLPSLFVSVFGMVTGADPQIYLSEMINDNHSALNAALQSGAIGELAAELERYALNEGLLFLLLNIAAGLVASVISLGLLHALQQLLRGKEISAGMAFSRLGVWHKAVGVSVLTALRIVLWGLPGFALLLGGSFLMLDEATVAIGSSLSYVGTMLCTILTIRANYSYILSSYVLADKPETGVLACVRTSCQRMKGRRMQLFALEISFLIWTWASTMLGGLIGGVIGSTIGMALQLLVLVYQKTAVSAFYMVNVGQRPLFTDASNAKVPPEEDPTEEDEAQETDDTEV